jgi:hypothetical protein
MTALDQYQRLETSGVWRGAPDEQRRDVTVSLGTATLVIYDGAGRALAHWSLPALERLNPGKEPALYAPGPGAPEELEIEEPEMVEAIERIRTVIEKRRPHRGRLRGVLMLGSLAAVIGLGVYWVPDALVRHAAAIVPPVKRADLGARILTHVERLSGRPCQTPEGSAALDRLQARLMPGSQLGALVVLSSGAMTTGHLPGGLILLSRRLVEDYDTPDVVAGYVLAEAQRAAADDAIVSLLEQAGPLTAARLLTTGDVPEAALADYAEDFMTRHPAPIDDQALLAAFRSARVSTQPYAYAVDISGEQTLPLIEADPGRAEPVLPDSAWISLQTICGE